jgi:hypothetical protein
VKHLFRSVIVPFILSFALLMLAASTASAQTPKLTAKAHTECLPGDESSKSDYYPAGHWGYAILNASCKDGKWVYDKELEAREWARYTAEKEARKKRDGENADLVIAARTRLLSPAELKTLIDRGASIIPPDGSCFPSDDHTDFCQVFDLNIDLAQQREFDELLLQQFRFKLAGEPTGIYIFQPGGAFSTGLLSNPLSSQPMCLCLREAPYPTTSTETLADH